MDTIENITSGLRERARSAPDAVAIVGPESSISYARLDRLVWRVAQSLHDRGVRPASVAAATFITPLPCAVTLLALARLGATCVPLPRSCGALERRELAASTCARWLITDRPDHFDGELPILGIDIPGIVRSISRIDTGILDPRPAAPWQVILGSGSTGAPKLIPVTHAQVARRAESQIASFGVTPADCLASLSGLEFNTARQTLIRALCAGARFAILESPRVGQLES